MKNTPEEIWSQYTKCVEYLSRNEVFQTVKKNEDFYDGRQWKGLENVQSLPKPVFNFLQRAGKFMVATIGSNDISINMQPYSDLPGDVQAMDIISDEVEHVVEQAKIKEQSKIMIRNAFVDGSCYFMQSFDPFFETHQPQKGRIVNEIIDNTNMYFGNPYNRDIQTQPYIIVSLRQHISQVRREAKKYGVPKDQIERITPDDDFNQANDDSDSLVTVLLKYYKDDKDGEETVWFTKVTRNVTIIKPTNLGYKRYPISCFGWDIKKNSYIYNSPMTYLIPNQVFANKAFAISMMYGLQNTFPKIVYDKSKVDIEDLMNSYDPQAVGNLDLMGKVMDFIKVPDFSNNIITLGETTINLSRELMGVTDASLGQVRPENTSAIIALQESSNVPLEIQKQSFYEMWEDTVRNIIDIMACSYGIRKILTSDGQLATVDFSLLRNLNFNLNVEIGNSAQFSEIAQINTLDKIVQAGWLPPDEYADIIPSKYLPQKTRVVNAIRNNLMQMAQMNAEPQAVGSTTANDTKPI